MGVNRYAGVNLSTTTTGFRKTNRLLYTNDPPIKTVAYNKFNNNTWFQSVVGHSC